jgi:hypothetical protein
LKVLWPPAENARVDVIPAAPFAALAKRVRRFETCSSKVFRHVVDHDFPIFNPLSILYLHCAEDGDWESGQ